MIDDDSRTMKTNKISGLRQNRLPLQTYKIETVFKNYQKSDDINHV